MLPLPWCFQHSLQQQNSTAGIDRALLSSSAHEGDSTSASRMELAQPQHQHFLENIHFRKCFLLTQNHCRGRPTESKTDRLLPNRYHSHSKTENIAYPPRICGKRRLNTYFGEFCTKLGKEYMQMCIFAYTFFLTLKHVYLANAVWAVSSNSHQCSEVSGPASAAHNSKTYTREETEERKQLGRPSNFAGKL